MQTDSIPDAWLYHLLGCIRGLQGEGGSVRHDVLLQHCWGTDLQQKTFLHQILEQLRQRGWLEAKPKKGQLRYTPTPSGLTQLEGQLVL